MPYIIDRTNRAVHTIEQTRGENATFVSWEELDIRTPNEVPDAEDPLDRISAILTAYNASAALD
jgi:hypothetical protein